MSDPSREDTPSFVVSDSGEVVIRVRVIPRAGRTCLAGRRGDALLVRLAAAPVDGAANDELLTFLASSLGIPRRSLRLASGERNRDKTIRVQSLSAIEIVRRLA